MDRRAFIKAGFAGAAALDTNLAKTSAQSAARGGRSGAASPSSSGNWEIAVFTDFVDDAEYGFSYKEVASLIRQLGVSGPDLTVRPGGLVAPERVTEDLPKAAEVFREHGLSIPMISTGITSARDQAARQILRAAAELGIKYYKMGYYSYRDFARWPSELNLIRKELEFLVAAGRWEGIQALFLNHSGSLGGTTWDCWELIEPLEPDWIGSIFDPSHATIEGGRNGWILGFYRLAPRIKAISVQDFYWEKVEGRWRARWCPLGEGMVDWEKFFKTLSGIGFGGPISLAINYDPGGKTKAERFERSLAAAKRDAEFLKGQLKKAFG